MLQGVKKWILILMLLLQDTASGQAQETNTFSCLPSTSTGTQVFLTPNIPDFYFDLENTAAFTAGAEANLTQSITFNTYIYTIPPQSARQRNCSGPVLAIEYCYTTFGFQLGVEMVVFDFLILRDSPMPTVDRRISIQSTPRSEICRIFTPASVVCCDTTTLGGGGVGETFQLPPTSFVFGLSLRLAQVILFSESATQFSVQDTAARVILLLQEDSTITTAMTSNSLPLMRFHAEISNSPFTESEGTIGSTVPNPGDSSTEGTVGDSSTEGTVGDSSTEGTVGDSSTEGTVGDSSTEGTVGDSSTVGYSSTEGTVGDSSTVGYSSTEGTVPNPGFIAGALAAATLLTLAALIVTASLIAAKRARKKASKRPPTSRDKKIETSTLNTEERPTHSILLTPYQAYSTGQGEGERDILQLTQNTITATKADTRESIQNHDYSTCAEIQDARRQARDIQLMRNQAYATGTDTRDNIRLTQNQAYSTATHITTRQTEAREIQLKQNQAYATAPDNTRDGIQLTQNQAYSTATHITKDGQRQTEAEEIQLKQNQAYATATDNIHFTQNQAYSTATQQSVQHSQDQAHVSDKPEDNGSYSIGTASTDNHRTPVEGQHSTTVELELDYHAYDYIYP